MRINAIYRPKDGEKDAFNERYSNIAVAKAMQTRTSGVLRASVDEFTKERVTSVEEGSKLCLGCGLRSTVTRRQIVTSPGTFS